MQTRASGLVVAGLCSFALALGAGGTAQANTSPELTPASAFESAGAEQGQWFEEFAQSAIADEAALVLPAFDAAPAAEPAAEPAGASADQAMTAGAPSPAASEQAVQPLGGGSDHGAPPKHEPPKQEPPKHEPPKHEPPKQEPPKHDEHGGKPGQDEQHQGQGQGQAQGQGQDQNQGQAQGQNQTVVVTVVVENKIENKVENKQENHQSLHNSNHNANHGNVHVSNTVALPHKGEHAGSHTSAHGKPGADLSRPPAQHEAEALESAPVAKGELAHTGSGELPLLLGATALIGTGGVLIRFNRSRRV